MVTDNDSTIKACLKFSYAKIIETSHMDPKSCPLTASGKKKADNQKLSFHAQSPEDF